MLVGRSWRVGSSEDSIRDRPGFRRVGSLVGASGHAPVIQALAGQ